MKKKRYFFNVIEEMIMNENAEHFRGGRIEVYDEWADSPYAVYEARFWLPIEFYQQFRDTFDFKRSDHLPEIQWGKF